MTTKTVAQLDPAGFYIGPVLADESPLEPGVFLIPGGAVDTEPPLVPAGQRARWTESGWALEDPPRPQPRPEPAVLTPEEITEAAIAACKAAARQRLESTDWAELPSARADMANAQEFDAYRSAVRALFINPVASPVWPPEPNPAWLAADAGGAG